MNLELIFGLFSIPDGVACGQDRRSCRAQDVDGVLPGCSHVKRAGRADRPPAFLVCAQARCPFTQAVHRVVHKISQNRCAIAIWPPAAVLGMSSLTPPARQRVPLLPSGVAVHRLPPAGHRWLLIAQPDHQACGLQHCYARRGITLPAWSRSVVTGQRHGRAEAASPERADRPL
jgi:hypothetical protein